MLGTHNIFSNQRYISHVRYRTVYPNVEKSVEHLRLNMFSIWLIMQCFFIE